MQNVKLDVDNLPDDFKMTDKEILKFIRDLFEMIKDNNLELIEEYFPAKSWVSILYLCYTTIVRNSLYNKNQFTKIK